MAKMPIGAGHIRAAGGRGGTLKQLGMVFQ